MPSCPPLSCPARICPFRAHCPSSNACFLTIRLALLTLKPSAGATGSSADGAAKPANPTASPTGRRSVRAYLRSGSLEMLTQRLYRPPYRCAFLDPLLRSTALVVVGDDVLGRSLQVGD